MRVEPRWVVWNKPYVFYSVKVIIFGSDSSPLLVWLVALTNEGKIGTWSSRQFKKYKSVKWKFRYSRWAISSFILWDGMAAWGRLEHCLNNCCLAPAKIVIKSLDGTKDNISCFSSVIWLWAFRSALFLWRVRVTHWISRSQTPPCLCVRARTCGWRRFTNNVARWKWTEKCSVMAPARPRQSSNSSVCDERAVNTLEPHCK